MTLGAVFVLVLMIVLKVWWPDANQLTTYARKGDLEGVEFCRRLGVDLNEPSRWGWNLKNNGKTAMTAAAESGKTDVVKYLLQHGAEINRADGFGLTPMMGACFSGELALVEFLYEEGADPTLAGPNGTALHLAAALGHLPVVAFLLDKGVPVNISDDSGRPP